MDQPERAAARDALRAELPDLAEFVDALRDVCGPGVRVQGIQFRDGRVIGRPHVPAGVQATPPLPPVERKGRSR